VLCAALSPAAVPAERAASDAPAPRALLAPPRDAWRANGGNLSSFEMTQVHDK
jgi:hypothetical protein